ncbi:DUF1697 domain-containing protein [Paenibacillus sp. FSL R7-0297]|uniref:DUF1697 domain-containing protein n=1 Tax=unclassified Paenibacillus TaxID=185978 RepID=UPI0004F89C81|nr:DUF1697 domain-containing protein [Paenibacillus sp. FSL R5-0912]AIQ39129.1 hypothetical protein R50912_03005 [Paenibacillus sp. FSL R5-0912]
MSTYIALLRGINVGGNKLIKMQELKAMFAELQYENVRTYIQSGNVVFESEESSAIRLSEVISQRIQETFGFGVPVIIRSLEELEAVIAGNPFPLTEPEEFKRLYVSFLDAEPSAEALEMIRPYEDGADRVRVVGKEMYTYYEVSVSESPLFKVQFDRLLGTTLTARNWNTLGKVTALARKP